MGKEPTRDARSGIRGALSRFLMRDDGPTAVEYAVMLALILIVAIAAISALGGGVEGRWKSNSDKLVSSMR
jgi:pilus assembly protein Flp/PilA